MAIDSRDGGTIWGRLWGLFVSGEKRCNSSGSAASLRAGWGLVAGESWEMWVWAVFWACFGFMRWKSGQILAKVIVAVTMPVVLIGED